MSRTLPLAPQVQLHPYSSVAAEYYNAERHPTCRNFRDASRSFLREALHIAQPRGRGLEVGAGDSLLAELEGEAFERLILLDNSTEMLSYSKRFQRIARLVVGDARALPFPSSSISLIAASLADPFNLPLFWSEARRVLEKGGCCIVTLPSYEWASSFRKNTQQEREGAALFKLRTGKHVHLPSSIRSEPDQVRLMSSFGFVQVASKNVTLADIPRPYSPKLFGTSSIVTGYVLQAV
jgi:ubiquinone/menaquinone biosynthesis C-methylase UbiE